jgi:hypothetical protein
MKTAELRDAMVARVADAFGKWRTFYDMPEVDDDTSFDIRVAFKADLAQMQGGQPVNYIEALHAMCAVCDPVARIGNDMVGLTDVYATVAKQGIDADKGAVVE